MSDMATVTLKHLVRDVDRHGNVRHYFRAPGRAKVRLHGEPGSRGFLDAYAAALAAMGDEKPSAGAAPRPGSISALCVAYYQSADFAALADHTRYTYRQLLVHFRETYGTGPAAKLTAPQIITILDKRADTPAQTKILLKVLRALFRFAAARGLVRHNPAAAVTFKVRKTDGYRAWTDDDIAKFEAHWPSGSRAR
jgi:hypothetical protein